MRKIIGLVGFPGSGKNEASNYLATQGFVVFSFSDLLRNILAGLNQPDSRQNMQDLGDIIRENIGADALARGIKNLIDKNPAEKFVVEGIRNPAELKFLKTKLRAYILGIKMSEDKMLELIKTRGKLGDPENLSEFKKMIKREKGVGEKETGLQINKCLDLADNIITNETTLEDFHKKLDDEINSSSS